MTRVRRITEGSELPALREDWNRLCGLVPFCRFDWNSTWWRHYHQDGELYVLEVRDDADRVIGIAPWYLKRNASQGRVLAFMAAGEVCSDYQTVLCEPGCESQVAAALADWLSDVRDSLTEWVTREDRDRWDLIEWESVPLADHMLKELAEQLKQRGAAVYQRPSDSYWRIPLTDNLADYEALLSKSHRKQVRRSLRNFLESGRAVLHAATEKSHLETGMQVLIKLHQKRWTTRGEAGVFASPRFTAFHREIMEQFLDQGVLRLYWLEIDGQPAAAEYGFAGDDAIYAYQAGVEPTMLKLEPGRISKVAMIQSVIAEGKHALDLLRGDEPYKAHWRGEKVPCLELRIVARRAASRLRNKVWLAGGRVKRMINRPTEQHSPIDGARSWQKLSGALDWSLPTTAGAEAEA